MYFFEKNYRSENFSEHSAAYKFEEIKNSRKVKSDERRHKGLSFETIFSSGANCADIHHTPSKDKIITGDELILMDFGSQYL